MAANTICNASFSLKPLNEVAYELNVHFEDQEGKLVSNKKVTFSQEHPSVEKGEILDVYSQNGTCSSSILQDLFSKRDLQGIQKITKNLKIQGSHGPVVFVLDLQDPHTQYESCVECAQQSIAKCESVVCSFFQKKVPDTPLSDRAQKIHTLFQNNMPLDFVICEGSLKMELLKKVGFTDKEIEFFLKTSSGSKSLCQFTEFFMNAFKLGQVAHTQGGNLTPEKFIQPISTKPFKPHAKSTVFYPASYKELYSPQGTFANVLKSVFSVSGMLHDESKITTMTVEVKQ